MKNYLSAFVSFMIHVLWKSGAIVAILTFRFFD